MKKFTRTIENFSCKNCGIKVNGNGFTNHCPNCLWSMHVDINPGDRSEECKGLMEPVGMELKNGEYKIIHKCKVCGITKINKTSKADNFSAIMKISALNINY